MASKNPSESLLFIGASSDLSEAMAYADISAFISDSESGLKADCSDMVVLGGPDKLASAVVSAKKTLSSVKLSLLIAAITSLILFVLSIFGIAVTWFVLIIEIAVAEVLVLFSSRLMFWGRKK